MYTPQQVAELMREIFKDAEQRIQEEKLKTEILDREYRERSSTTDKLVRIIDKNNPKILELWEEYRKEEALGIYTKTPERKNELIKKLGL